MILTAHQPVYLPWLGLFHKIALADRFVSFNQVQYQPKSWNNRNKINTDQGPIWLSVPVLRKGYLDKKYTEIRINSEQPWGRKHWQSILQNYKAAPNFGRYADYFEDVYSREWETLGVLNETMLQWFLEQLGLPHKVESAADFNFQGSKSGLVLDMCRHLDADHYIFGSEGKNYADRGSFAEAEIQIHFQEYRHPVYEQIHSKEFDSHLSIVDLLFNCGESSLDVLMEGNLSSLEVATAG